MTAAERLAAAQAVIAATKARRAEERAAKEAERVRKAEERAAKAAAPPPVKRPVGRPRKIPMPVDTVTATGHTDEIAALRAEIAALRDQLASILATKEDAV